MDYRKARFYGIWCQIAAFGLIILAIVYLNSPWLYIFGTLGVLSGLVSAVLLLLFWRCPRCRRRLPADKGIFEIRECPFCLEDLKLEPMETQSPAEDDK